MKIKVLLVDDEKEFIEVLSERLEVRGFDVKTALSGEEALKWIYNSEFHVVLLDVRRRRAILERVQHVDAQLGSLRDGADQSDPERVEPVREVIHLPECAALLAERGGLR